MYYMLLINITSNLIVFKNNINRIFNRKILNIHKKRLTGQGINFPPGKKYFFLSKVEMLNIRKTVCVLTLHTCTQTQHTHASHTIENFNNFFANTMDMSHQEN